MKPLGAPKLFDLFASLPEPQRATIEAQAAANAAKFSGSLRTSMIEFGKNLLHDRTPRRPAHDLRAMES